MDKEFFIPSLQYDNAFSNSIPQWQTLTSTMEIQSSQSQDSFLSTPPPQQPPTSTTDNFESALSSMVSSPAASNSALTNENIMIRELIGKLGNICNSSQGPPPPYISNGGENCSNSNSCYSTPLSSPPKMNMPMPIIDHLVKENFPSLGNSIALSSNLPAMPSDPGFAERAAKFSSFGSRSFNGSISQFKVNNNNKNNCEVGYGSNINNNGKLQRVSSSPSLKAAGSLAQINKISSLLQNQGGNCGQQQGEFSNSPENSSISRQNHAGENGSNRKRKAVAPKSKTKDSQSQSQSQSLASATNGAQNVEHSSAKRSKSEEGDGEAKAEANRRYDGKNQNNDNQKPPEPPKDYIHVRARRGQATDSHSLAERVRREKISERMKLLQDLVPGCDKVTGKALMLDEIINYVQSLQRQVEFLSMKLANVNPRLEFNMGDIFSKDVIQPNSTMPHPMYPLDSLASPLYGQPHQNPLQDSIPTTAPCPMDPLSLNPTINNQNHALHLPTIDGFSNGLPQLPSLCEGDLQSIVEMEDKRKMYFNHNLYMGQIHHH